MKVVPMVNGLAQVTRCGVAEMRGDERRTRRIARVTESIVDEEFMMNEMGATEEGIKKRSERATKELGERFKKRHAKCVRKSIQKRLQRYTQNWSCEYQVHTIGSFLSTQYFAVHTQRADR
jgi:hypothetical protein